MKTRIKKIVLRRFRGATNVATIEFDPKKPIAFIFGENGCGKSSIIDGIDMVCNSSFGSISDRSSTTANQHLPALGSKVADIAIELSTVGGNWTASLGGKVVSVKGPPDPPKAKILRRSQLLSLVEATPGKRYEAFRQFLDVNAVEAAEATLIQAGKEAKDRLHIAVNSHSEAFKNLEESFKAEGHREGTPLEVENWAEKRVANSVATLAAQKKQLQATAESYKPVEDHVSSMVEAFTDGQDKKRELAKHQKRLKALEGEQAEADQNLLTALSSADAYIASKDSTDRCPVCEQEIAGNLLRQIIARRLSALQEYGDLSKQIEGKQREIGNIRLTFNVSLGKAEEYALSLLASLLNCLPILGEATNEALSAAQIGISASQGVAKGEAIIAAKKLCAAYLGAVSSTLERIGREFNLHTAIQKELNQLRAKRAEMQQNAALQTRLAGILDEMQGVRKDYTNAVLLAVTDCCQRHYEKIHPGERIGISSFALDPKQRASVKQICSFEGKDDVVPQGYFSEAHLDTLGFVLWLALAEFSTNGDCILVLDDVFTSADSPHLSRIIRLLSEQAEKFDQIIIATHNRTWQAYYKNECAQVHLLELNEWSMARGITASNVLPGTQELIYVRNALPFDRQSVASTLRANIDCDILLG
jgi:ABC-type cobalamin/Fe3+-siderophores transport system ATPase subunit